MAGRSAEHIARAASVASCLDTGSAAAAGDCADTDPAVVLGLFPQTAVVRSEAVLAAEPVLMGFVRSILPPVPPVPPQQLETALSSGIFPPRFVPESPLISSPGL